MRRRALLRSVWWLLACLTLMLAMRFLSPVEAASGIDLTINQINDSHFPEVVAYVSLNDGNGLPIADVPAASFEAAEDGQPIADLAVQPVVNAERGVALVLALDVSGSMEGVPLQATQEAAKALVNRMGSEDRAAILAFNEELSWVQDFTADQALLVQAIDTLTPVGDTAFNDALFEAAERIAALPASRRAILILTDGADTASTLSLEDAINKAQGNSTPVFTIGFGDSIQPELLLQTARLTGGQYFEVPQADDLVAGFQRVIEQLKQQYMVTYQSQLMPDMKEHELLIRVTFAQDVLEDSRRFLARAVKPVVMVPPLEEGAVVSGRVQLAAQLISDSPISQVVYQVDGTPLAELPSFPYELEWDSAEVSPGEHTLSLQITNEAGEMTLWESLVTVLAPLSVRFTSPMAGDDLGGQVTLAVEWEAAYELEEIVYSLDGQVLETTTASPFQVVWHTGEVTTGTHRLAAQARDVEGNESNTEIEVNVIPPLSVRLQSPQSGEIVSGTVGVEADIEAMSGLSKVEFWVNGEQISTLNAPPFTFAWDSSQSPPGEYILEVRAVDLTGEQGEHQVTVKVPLVQQGLDRQWLMALLGGGILFVLFVAWLARRRVRAAQQTNPVRSSPLPQTPQVPPIATAWLVWHHPGGAEERFRILEGENSLGRSASENQIVIPRPTVSRRHALIRYHAGSYMFENISERSISAINREPVDRTHTLQHGDEIELGDETLVFMLQEEEN